MTPYIDSLHREFVVAAAANGNEARALAEHLTTTLSSAIRLTLLDALSAAAEEITRDLAPGSVDVRLRSGGPEFVVTLPQAEQAREELANDSVELADPADDGAISRINVRSPAHLKSRIEEAASRESLSVNAWILRAATAALPRDNRRSSLRTQSGGERYTGWLR